MRSGKGRGVLEFAVGPRAAEAFLLDWVEQHRPVRPEDLGRKLRIIVPSRSLRKGILKKLMDRFGALAGVVIQTHYHLAQEFLEAGALSPIRPSSLLQELIIRRIASETTDIGSALREFSGTSAPLIPAVRDLIDAGLDSETTPAAIDALKEAFPGGENGRRNREILSIATRCLVAQEKADLPGQAELLRQCSLMLEEGDLAHRVGKVLIFGYAEATGLVSLFLQSLARVADVTVLIDHPPHPADRSCVVSEFTARLETSLGLPVSQKIHPKSPAPAINVLRSPGPAAQAREVAARIRNLLDAGRQPENIAVLDRLMDPATLALLSRYFRDLGIPFSVEGAVLPSGRIRRRGKAFFRLLDDGLRAPIENYFSLLMSCVDNPTIIGMEERAFRSMGRRRIGEVPGFSWKEHCKQGFFRLGVVLGLAPEGKKLRPKIPCTDLESRTAAIGDVAEVLARRPSQAAFRDLLSWLREVLDFFCIPSETGDRLELVLEGLEKEIPGDLRLRWEEFAPVLEEVFEESSQESPGGQGGGIQILSVMEARGRCFDHLFLLNCLRGVFPRPSREDPVFPEACRRALLPVLPEIPLAGRRSAEEMYLFAGVLDSTAEITLAWPESDAGGRKLNPSVFLLSMELAGKIQLQDTLPCPDVHDERRGPRPLQEREISAGLAGRFPVSPGGSGSMFWDRKRWEHLGEVLREMEAGRGLGAYLGWTGRTPPSPLWVTRLETFAQCPWRAFLEKTLGLAPVDDGLDFRHAPHALVGSTVHRVLEEMACTAGVPSNISLSALREGSPRPVRWPAQAKVEEMTFSVARDLAGAEGCPLLGPVIGRMALAFLERARNEDWKTGSREILGVEIRGGCRLELQTGESVELCFKADRVEIENEKLVLTDYKTGTVPTGKAKTSIGRGLLLQGAAYTLSRPNAVGRYLVLKEGSAKRLITIEAEDAEVFAKAFNILYSGWKEACCFPRWSVPGGGDGRGCAYCPVKEACYLGEPEIRKRVEDAMSERAERDPHDAIVALWHIVVTPARGAS